MFTFKNDGWGIFVDAVDGATSTSKIHIERCKIEENKGGGIKWTGIGGVIEQCGIYANGVLPKGMKVILISPLIGLMPLPARTVYS